jgi:hypothetical protein
MRDRSQVQVTKMKFWRSVAGYSLLDEDGGGGVKMLEKN